MTRKTGEISGAGMDLELEWQRCPDGAEVSKSANGGCIVRHKSDRREPVTINASRASDSVLLHFINARTDDEFAAFVSRFGLPSIADRCTMTALREIEQRLSALTVAALSPPTVPRERAINDAIRDVQLTPAVRVIGNKCALAILHPATLLQYMLMEIVIASANGADLAACENCTDLFFTGYATGRRNTARFCSDKCRAAFNRRQAKPKV